MKNKLITLCIALLSISLSGCAELQQDFIEHNCNSNAAYANGMNDAKNGRDMESNYASLCPVNAVALNASYQKGFEFGVAHMPPKTEVTVYNAGNVVNAGKQCISNDYGKQFCGYDCTKTSFRTQCAQVPTHNCVKNDFEIKCGQNCRVDDFDDLKCDVTE